MKKPGSETIAATEPGSATIAVTEPGAPDTIDSNPDLTGVAPDDGGVFDRPKIYGPDYLTFRAVKDVTE